MAVADIVGGERKPGSIRLRNVSGNLLVHLPEIMSAAEDALPWVGGIGNFGLAGRLDRQLHQPLGARWRGRAGIPFRLLVADGGQQAPVLTALFGRLFEPLFVERQTALQMPHESARADEFQVLGPAVI